MSHSFRSIEFPTIPAIRGGRQVTPCSEFSSKTIGLYTVSEIRVSSIYGPRRTLG